MKEGPMDAFERHVVYFLTGLVSVISIALVTVFIFAPVFLIGWQYLLVMPVLIVAIYFIGRNIINKVK
jgi:hypothetical protein